MKRQQPRNVGNNGIFIKFPYRTNSAQHSCLLVLTLCNLLSAPLYTFHLHPSLNALKTQQFMQSYQSRNVISTTTTENRYLKGHKLSMIISSSFGLTGYSDGRNSLDFAASSYDLHLAFPTRLLLSLSPS